MKISAVYYEQPVAIVVTYQVALLYVNYGEGELIVNGDSTIAIVPQRVFLINSDTQVVLAAGELAGYLVEFAMLALEHFLARSVGHRNKGIFDRSSLVPNVDLIKDEVHFLKSILAQFTTKIEMKSSYALLEQYFFMLLVHVNLHAEYTTNFDKKLANLAMEIAVLIDANFINHRKISFYAKEGASGAVSLITDRPITMKHLIWDKRLTK
ncbi:MAG: hypothetical protein V4594_21860 [Bacteroidota bacterium]